MKRVLVLALRLALLTILYLVLFTFASGVSFALLNVTFNQSAEQAGDSLMALLAVSFLNTLVLALMIARSRWSGHRLALVVAVVLFGVQFFMTQIETLIFPSVLNRLPPNTVPALFLAGILLAAPFAPLAVLLMGKWRHDPSADAPNERLVMPATSWLWRLAALAIIYIGLYFVFGYFVAWRNPSVPAYYGGTDPGSFVAQLMSVASNSAWLFPFQFLRGILWVLIALPVVRMLKGGAAEAGLIVGLLFAVVMNSQHLLPNPAMPEAVRMAHLAETASSNFIFGVVVAELLLWRAKTASMFSRPAPLVR